MIPRKVYLAEISLKLMSRQDSANAGQMKDMQHNDLRSLRAYKNDNGYFKANVI